MRPRSSPGAMITSVVTLTSIAERSWSRTSLSSANAGQWRCLSFRSTSRRLPGLVKDYRPLPLTHKRRASTLEELDNFRDGRERVVILGSGWAGFPLATTLDPRKYQVIVVSPRSYFVFTPLLAEASCGTIELRTTVEPIRGRKNKHIHYVQAWADEVDFYNKRLTVEEAVVDPRQGLALTAGSKEQSSPEEVAKEHEALKKKGRMFDFGYDKLVISVGCYLQTFNTPGVVENAYFLKDVGDARKIRTRLLECFEMAALPTMKDETRKKLLTFAIIGGGPTGVEFSGELHDIIFQDLKHLYPDLVKFARIIVYDVAPDILSMFDAKLGDYAKKTLNKENIEIKTSRNILGLERGFPGQNVEEELDLKGGLTLKIKDEADLGIGMCVWSTGLAQNPFIAKSLSAIRAPPPDNISIHKDSSAREGTEWTMSQHKKTGSIMTDHQLRVLLQPVTEGAEKEQSSEKSPQPQAALRDVFAIGDCAIMQDAMYPATAQVASQKAYWLGKRLNKGDLEQSEFKWKNLGTMAYLGGASGVVQGAGGIPGLGNISGRAAWIMWKGAYLTKALSWRNKILLPVYWFTNWLFGRDISRF